jgi:hypothetical protein
LAGRSSASAGSRAKIARQARTRPAPAHGERI